MGHPEPSPVLAVAAVAVRAEPVAPAVSDEIANY
jgi:hypothetical protein